MSASVESGNVPTLMTVVVVPPPPGAAGVSNGDGRVVELGAAPPPPPPPAAAPPPCPASAKALADAAKCSPLERYFAVAFAGFSIVEPTAAARSMPPWIASGRALADEADDAASFCAVADLPSVSAIRLKMPKRLPVRLEVVEQLAHLALPLVVRGAPFAA